MNLRARLLSTPPNLPVRFGLLALALGLAASGLAQDAPSPDLSVRVHSPRRGSPVRVRDVSLPGGPRRPAPPNLLFFPPAPPPLDAAPPSADAATPEFSAPDELGAFVNEPFYAPLGTRLASSNPDDRLGDEQKRQLDAYRANKAAMQTELLARLYTLRETDTASRLRSLESFAREQTPQLAALESAAESFRHDLIRINPGENSIRPGNRTAPGSPDEKKPVVPATTLQIAIFYGEGLSPSQRRLAREILIEHDDSERDGRPSAKAASWIFFSPDTARVQLPLPLPAALAGQIANYVKTRDLLKRELRDALCTSGMVPPTGGRRQVLETLAVEQAPRIAAMEALAEEIRRGLQGLILDPLHVPHLQSLPAELEARIAGYRRDKLELQKELLARVREITGREASGSPASEEKTQHAIAAFTQENASRYTALDREKEGIRGVLAHIAAAAREGESGNDQSADHLLKNFADSFQQYEQWRLYYEYRIAVFEPGLSPEQRRLLFDGAVEKLALPLPGGTP